MNSPLLQLLQAAASGSMETIIAAVNSFFASQPDMAKLSQTMAELSPYAPKASPQQGLPSQQLAILWEIFAQWLAKTPDIPHLARCLAFCDASRTRREAYLAYARALEGNYIPVPPLVRAPRAPGERPLRVSFITDYVSPRVTRHMACAKQGGMVVQGLFKEAPVPYTTLAPPLYDELSFYRDCSHDLNAIIEKVVAFDADIVHLPTHMHVNETTLALTCALPFPVVGDAYDLINVIFNPEIIIRHGFKPQLAAEKAWFRNVDGLCMRSKVLKYANKNGMLRPKTTALFFPEVCVETSIQASKLSDYDGKTHCLVTGTMDYMFGECLLQMATVMNGANIMVHIVPTYYEKGKNNPAVEQLKDKLAKFNCFQLHHTMPHRHFLRFLAKIDVLLDAIFIELPVYDTAKTGETTATILHGMGNRICDALEQDVAIMVSPQYEDRAKFAATANRAIFARREELMSREFWAGLLTTVRRIRQVPRNLTPFAAPRQSGRLERFYRAVMRRALARRGVL